MVKFHQTEEKKLTDEQVIRGVLKDNGGGINYRLGLFDFPDTGPIFNKI